MDSKKIKYKFHHIGIPTNTLQKNERYSSKFKMYTSDSPNSDFHIQYHRFEKDSPLPELLKTVTHIAFKVDNMNEAIEGKKILLEPYFPFEGFQVAVIEDSGMPIELIETNLTDEEIWNSTKKKSIIYPDEELLDLVDENDNVIGSLSRSLVYKKGLNNFRVINAFIVNTKGQLWIPRRTAHKTLFPLYLDVGIGGHVSSGETYDEAFSRELEEEANLKLNEVSYSLLGHLTPHGNNVSAFMKVYKVITDKTPNFNREDFFEYFWLTPTDFFEKINQGDKSKGDVPKLIKHFLKELTL